VTYPIAILGLGVLAFLSYLVHVFIVLKSDEQVEKRLNQSENRIHGYLDSVVKQESKIMELDHRIQTLENVKAFSAKGERSPFPFG